MARILISEEDAFQAEVMCCQLSDPNIEFLNSMPAAEISVLDLNSKGAVVELLKELRIRILRIIE